MLQKLECLIPAVQLATEVIQALENYLCLKGKGQRLHLETHEDVFHCHGDVCEVQGGLHLSLCVAFVVCLHVFLTLPLCLCVSLSETGRSLASQGVRLPTFSLPLSPPTQTDWQ